MKIQKINQRGTLFIFDLILDFYTGTVNIYAINGKKYFFIIDTYMGPKPIKEIKEYLYTTYGKKPFIVFNTHFHFDHIWGNCAFTDTVIISHKQCYNNIIKFSKEELANYTQYQQGKVKIILPSLTFDKSISFSEEKVIFFHSSGHTNGSASCYDEYDKVLHTGDNVEEPIPFITDSTNLDEYDKSLQSYIKIKPKIIISSHSNIVDEKLIKENIIYINN